MSIKDRKEQDRKNLHNKILTTAFDIISQDGFQALTIRKLADQIEYSPRTIYLYFKDKEELLKAIVEYGYSFSVNNLKAQDFYNELTAEELLKTIITNHLKTAIENVQYYKTIIHVIQGQGFEPGPNQKLFHQFLVEKMAPHLKSDANSSENALFLLTASLRGIATELINKKSPLEINKLTEITEMIFQLFKSYLK